MKLDGSPAERFRIGQPWRPPGQSRPWVVVREQFQNYGDSTGWCQVETIGTYSTEAEAEARLTKSIDDAKDGAR